MRPLGAAHLPSRGVIARPRGFWASLFAGALPESRSGDRAGVPLEIGGGAMWLRTAVAAMTLLICGVAWAQTLEAPDLLMAFDSKGTRLGPVYYQHDGRAALVFTIDGEVVMAWLTAEGFSQQYTAWFETSDCSGTPWLEKGGFGSPYEFTPARAFAPPGWTYYRPDPTIPPKRVAGRSQMTTDYTCLPRESTAYGFDGIAVIPVLDVRPLYTPPFHIEGVVFEPCYCPRRRVRSASPTDATAATIAGEDATSDEPE